MRNTLSLSHGFCLVLGLTVAPARADDAEDKAVEAITALGGTVTRDEQAAGKPVIGVSFASTGITSGGLKELKELKHLQSVNLNRCHRITDAGLKELKSLHNLKVLNLCLVPGGPDDVTREGVKELQMALPEASILR